MYGQYARDPWPIDKILAWTAKAGYEGTEFCGFHMPSPEDEYDTPEKCAALMALVKQNGLEAACYAAQVRAAPPSISAREDYMPRFEKALRFCINCSIPVMRLDSVFFEMPSRSARVFWDISSRAILLLIMFTFTMMVHLLSSHFRNDYISTFSK